MLNKAAEIVDGPRAQTYGHPVENIGRIAQLWEHYLSHPITAQDVCAMMMLVKIGRMASGVFHEDNLVDIAGYARVAEMVSKG